MSAKRDTSAETTPVMSATKDPVDELTTIVHRLSFPENGDKGASIATPPQSPRKGSNVSRSTIAPGTEQYVKTGPSLILTPPATPLKEAKPIAVDNSLEKRPDSAALSVKLGLDSWKCGGLTKLSKKCEKWIPKKNRPEINLEVKSMVRLDRSSPELRQKLNKLTGLVHCRSHRDDSHRQCRVASWEAIFPKKCSNNDKGDNYQADLLIEGKIRSALGETISKCTEYMKFGGKGQPCQPLGGQRVQNCTRTIDKLVKRQVYSDESSLDYYLQVLERNRHCDSHQFEKHDELIASWKSSILAVIGPSHLGIPTKSEPLSFTQDPAEFWPKALDGSQFILIRRPNERPSPDSLIADQNKKSWSQAFRNPGYVYVMTDKANPGYVKIGFTWNTCDKRAGQLRWACNRDIKLYDSCKTNYAKRVEGMCHAELDRHRIEFYCHACLMNHTEWFKISAEEAIKVVQAWSKRIELPQYCPPPDRS